MVKLVNSMTGDHPGKPGLVISNIATAGGLTHAKEWGISTEVIDDELYKSDREKFDESIENKLLEYGIDVVCLAGFMRILGPEIVNTFQDRMLNIHPSLLPKYPGLNTHARALDAGDKAAGCTVHIVTPELDAGRILGQARVRIDPDDTPQSLAARVLRQEHRLYPLVLRRFLEGQQSPLFLAPEL